MPDASKTGIAAVVWDLDGTMVDSALDIAAALNQLLTEERLPELEDERIRNMIGEGVPTLIQRGLAAHDETADEQQLGRLVQRFLEIYSASATNRTRLFPGVREVLATLGDAGIRQAVCTNKPEAITRQVLADLDIATHFDVVIGGDTLPRNKPDPLPLRTTLQRLGMSPEQSLMVGDSAIDVLTAHAAGVDVAFVTFGYGPPPSKPQLADFLVDDVAEIPALVAGDSTGRAVT